MIGEVAGKPGTTRATTCGSGRSALYVGRVEHHRPDGPRHGFHYTLAMPLLFVDELPALSRLHPLAALDPEGRGGAPRPLRLRRADFLAPHSEPLDAAVRRAVASADGHPEGALGGPGDVVAPTSAPGPVAMLAHLRTWGWLFNPLTLYYCYDPTGRSVQNLVLEVTNTPWHERAVYVIGAPGEHRVPKAMHVSPFLPMELDYRVRYGAPGDHVEVGIDVVDRASGALRLATALHLHRRPLDGAAVLRLLRGDPARVSAGIYHQAVRLGRRGARFHRHPDHG